MQTLLAILIVILTTFQLFVAGRIIDHGTFSVMIDDDEIGRSREHDPIPSSISSSPSANGSLTTPASVGDILNEPLLKNVAGLNTSTTANDTSASSILTAIRSASNASNLQQKVAVANENVNVKHRGYLNSKSARSPDKRPSAISIVQEDLLVVPLPNGGEAIAYDISAVDNYGNGYRGGVRSVPGLRPVLPVNQQSPGIHPVLPINHQSSELTPVLPVNQSDLNPDSWLTFQQQSDFAGSQPDLESNQAIDAADDLARTDDFDGQIPKSSHQMQQAGDVWIKRPASNMEHWNTANEWVQKPSNIEESNAVDEWAQIPSSIKSASGQDQDSTGERVPGRHFVHIRDDVPLESVQGEGRDDREDGRGQHHRQHRKDHGDEHHDEHKKQERQPIRKHDEEWRCLETGAGAVGRVEKLVCPPGLMITSFGLASLGNPQGFCSGQESRQPGDCHLDLSASLQARCAGKSVCDIESIRVADIENHCPGYTGESRAVIEYQCSPWVSKPAVQNSTIEHCQQVLNNGTLQCPVGQAILGFGFGFFGEIDGSCSKGISPGVCSRNVMTDLTMQCVGRNQCRVEVRSKQFGSACNNNTTPLSLAASFKCGSLAELVTNSTRMANQSYVSGNLQFAKGNGAEAKSVIGALIIAIGMISFVI